MNVPEELQRRVDAVQERLTLLAASEPAPGALTEPDEPSGERWEWGQAWAHVGEFPAYWMRQIRDVLAAPEVPDEPPPMGRVKTDPDRIGAIEEDRTTPTADLHARLVPQLEDLRTLIDELSADDWRREVRHSTLGVMAISKAVEVFLVGHLEQHADQLEGLLR